MITFLNLGRLGRLGNQMFEIASTIGIATKSRQDFAFPIWRNYDALERFGSRESIDVQDFFKNPLPVLEDPGRYQFQEYPYFWGYRDIHLPHGNFNLNAHMQSEKYFKHCAHVIRYYFQLKDPEQQIDNCAIHLRFGDYDNNYHPFATKEYIRNAMTYFPGSQFTVFSDDINHARRYFTDDDDVIYSEGWDYMSDFAIMQSHKDFIICNSTYSWWAAWLGNHPDKKVVCPRKWHGDHTGLDPTDIPAENWIVL